MTPKRIALAVGALAALAVGAAYVTRDRGPARPPASEAAQAAKPVTPKRRPAVKTTVSSQDESVEITLDRPEWLDKVESADALPADRLRFLRSKAEAPGDGSQDAPWTDLQAALRQLEPGDHLVILSGKFDGPIRVDEACQDGTPEKPIRVTAVEGVRLKGVRGPDPLLLINRSHWRFRGAEAHVDWSNGPAVRIEGPAKHVEIRQFHVRNGIGSGLVVGAGSTAATLRNNHVHHLGEPRKGGPEKHADRKIAGIRVESGVREIRLVDNNVHSIYGPSLEIHPDAAGEVETENNAIQENPPDD